MHILAYTPMNGFAALYTRFKALLTCQSLLLLLSMVVCMALKYAICLSRVYIIRAKAYKGQSDWLNISTDDLPLIRPMRISVE